jgi:hypothetical protein
VAVGPVAVFDFLIHKIKIDQLGDLAERVVGTNALFKTDIHTEQLLLGRVFPPRRTWGRITHHEDNLQAILE